MSEGVIIQLFAKPVSRERFEQKEQAHEISIKQRHCSHMLEIDEDLEEHVCTNCGKPFTTKQALFFILHEHQENARVQISSYNLRNEIHFLTEKRDKIKDEIKQMQSEKRKIVKLQKV